MENLKMIRKVKKLSNAQQRQQHYQQDTIPNPFHSPLYENDKAITHDSFSSSKRDYFSELSDEILLHIFRYIPKPLLLRYSVICKRWNRLMFDESLWRRYDLSNRVVNAEILIKLLNRGVKMFGLGRAELRKSSKKYITLAGSYNDLSSQIDYHLLNPIKVEYLDLTNTFIDVKSLNLLLKHCKWLKKLSLESLETNKDTYNYMCTNNKNLNTLNLCMCTGLDINALIDILNNLKQLKCLNIGWTCLDRESIVLLCKHLPSCLEKLNITGCKTTLLDTDIENLVQSCPNLIELDLSDAQSITSKSIELISNNLNKIEYLAFNRCYSIIPSSYLMLNRLNNLIAIDLFNILKEKSIETLKSCMPQLLYINRCPFSSIARPIVGYRRTSIWGYRLNDHQQPQQQ